MKNLKNLCLCVLLLLTVVACKKKTDDVNVTEGSMSAKIDGKTWTAGLSVQAVKASGTLSIAGTGNGGHIDLRLTNYTGLKTYQLGGSLTNMDNGKYATTTLPIVSYDSLLGLGAGQLVITKEEAGFIEGTFSFTAKNNTSGVTVNVTEGKFKAKMM